jgi:hypothetical protein
VERVDPVVPSYSEDAGEQVIVAEAFLNFSFRSPPSGQMRYSVLHPS